MTSRSRAGAALFAFLSACGGGGGGYDPGPGPGPGPGDGEEPPPGESCGEGARPVPAIALGDALSTGAAPLAIRFDAGATTCPGSTCATFAWDFGDATSGTGSTIEHTYEAEGTFVAHLTVTDAAGCSASAERTISVAAPLPGPRATIVFYGFSGVLTAHLDATFSSCPGWCKRATWDFGDGSPPVDAWWLHHRFPAPGTYTVTMRIEDGETGLSSTATHQIVLEPPDATIVFFGLSAPLTAHLDATFSSCAWWCKKPTWDFGDGSPPVRAWWLHHRFPRPGTYTVKMRIEDGETGIASTATETITICAP
jgi:PKD repeat protein